MTNQPQNASKNSNTAKKLTGSIIAVIILSLCLLISTAALTYTAVTVENNFFQTGSIKINLNDGKPIIEEHEFLFAPSITVTKEFFLENQSSWDVYYKLYFDEVGGGLAGILDVSIACGDQVLFQGKANQMTRAAMTAADDVLKSNERKTLTITFHFPEEADNDAQNLELYFTIRADAVQTKNNPGKLFD